MDKLKLIIASPLDQFQITDLFNINILNFLNINITNIGLYLTIGFIFIIILTTLTTNENKLVSNK